MRGYKKYPDEYQVKLIQFSEDMDEKYGEHMSEIKGFNKGGMVKKKNFPGGVTMKGKTKMASKKMMRGGMAAKTAPKRMRGGGMAKMARKRCVVAV